MPWQLLVVYGYVHGHLYHFQSQRLSVEPCGGILQTTWCVEAKLVMCFVVTEDQDGGWELDS